MNDTLNRPLHDLRISVIDRCNFRCPYCMPDNGGARYAFLEKEEWLSFDEIERVIRAFGELGTKRIRLTGGEPLVRKNLPELAARLGNLPGIEDLSLSTNATRLAKYAEPLYQAGISRINVSLDTHREDRFKAITQGKLSKVINGLMVA